MSGIKDRRAKAQPEADDRSSGVLCMFTLGLDDRLRENWHLVTLYYAFCDDSGSDGKGPVFVLGGLMGRENEVRKLDRSWKRKLQKKPAIQYFRMVEAHTRDGQFDKFTPKQRDARVNDLINLIRRSELTGIAYVLRWSDFRILQKEHPGEDWSPYQILFLLLTYNLAGYLHKTTKTLPRIQFVFDEQSKEGEGAARKLMNMKNSKLFPALELLGMPYFEDEKKMRPLQAADLFV